jgi:hypothetical protein
LCLRKQSPYIFRNRIKSINELINSTEQSPSWELIVTQLLRKFPPFYETRRFRTVFTTARHWSLLWATWIQSLFPHPFSLRSILILSSYLCLGLLTFCSQSVYVLKHCVGKIQQSLSNIRPRGVCTVTSGPDAVKSSESRCSEFPVSLATIHSGLAVRLFCYVAN